MAGGGQVDYYAVLGVPRDASAPDIRRAYRRVARRHHPDLNRHPDGPERFAAAAQAYEVLSDPAARARYDEQFPSHPVATRRSPPRSRPWPTAAGRRGVLELTEREAAHLARFPLRLVDERGTQIVVPAGTSDGDELVLRESDRLIVLEVRLKGLT
jgi:curved DNA-binding protein CbpA